MKKWEILNQLRIDDKGLGIKNLIKILLENRRVEKKKEIEDFLDPKLENVTIGRVEIDKKQLKKAIVRIKEAIRNREQIVVFGDYDVDGICGTAILWETLRRLAPQGKLYENVFPYIPHRIDEGYGLSIKGIENVKHQFKDVGLIITVDNGIVANKAVDFAKEEGIDVIITDHHVPSKIKPKALAIVHATKLCGTGVAWMFANVILNSVQDLVRKEMLKQVQHDNERRLELVALATVADLVPLKGANRTLLKFGLEALRNTKRVGLLELFKEAGLTKESIGVYEIGHMIAPRLNAMGRLEYAMDSLRLICTNNQKRAEELAQLLGSTNKERQDITLQATLHAIQATRNKKQEIKKLLFIIHESYEQGVIGLVAGKLVEEFYRPAIVVSKGKKFSKASARSVSGFNMIEFIRTASEFLVDAGGHPMAAGFTVETSKLLKLQKVLEDKAELMLNKDLLTRSLKIDCELPLSLINLNLYDALQELAPFGMGNPEPTFISKKVIVDDVRLVGMEGKHLKLVVSSQKSGVRLEGIAFGIGQSSKIHINDKIDIVYTIDENEWNGEKRLQLKIKDIETAS
ncbi:MAG: putative single-strand DNA-specific exonuclease, single-stranded-DNA-specific exonuclease [Candidatus Levybacteria bacterium]|nr:putative single-strand DNA-specific exonuclease, single-stranded-DNA-specific exonuclease [Candidatus Levybacteria bacterium]